MKTPGFNEYSGEDLWRVMRMFLTGKGHAYSS